MFNLLYIGVLLGPGQFTGTDKPFYVSNSVETTIQSNSYIYTTGILMMTDLHFAHRNNRQYDI